ncbi:MAG: uracil-DNA glycosylase [Acidobacteriota bacterium]|nr:uracil-DNA glycosylase [Acidobacteriota bacterium]
MSPTLRSITHDIVTCELCPRLRDYCRQVAIEKRKAFRNDVYWGKPVPGFGDARARLLIVGLAPAAHGGNRTGRVFTGDGRGASGEFLFAAMKDAGFANQITCDHADDGLKLTDAYILATARCAPPGNKPLPNEIQNCRIHLDREFDALRRVRVIVALGRLAWDAALVQLRRKGDPLQPRPAFGHRAVYRSPTGFSLIGSYHPSRQNTHTGRLTPQMLAAVFQTARELILKG